MCIKVIGIDPAPSKNSVVFDEEKGFQSLDAKKLQDYLESINEPALICWDAPLSGPQKINPERADRKFNLYMRDIEYFLKEQTPPEGISVQGYAGCSHWAISQMLLGLPIIGPYHVNGNNLHFQLLTEDNQKPRLLQTPGKHIVEVHPAVALWLWLKDISNIKKEFEKKKWMKKENNKEEMDWTYKGKDSSKEPKIKFFCEELKKIASDEKFEKCLSYAVKKLNKKISDIPATPKKERKIDDYFDAMIAWLLGKLWVGQIEQNGNNQVILLGNHATLSNQATGSMLLPNSHQLRDRWNGFIQQL